MTAATPLPAVRDYVAEMSDVIRAEVDGSTDPAPITAERIVSRLRTTDRDLLTGWLDAVAVAVVAEQVRHHDGAVRSHARAVAGRDEFSRAAAAGDVSGFLDARFVVDEDRHRMPLRDLTREHLLFVAKGYDATAKSARMEAAFFRAVAKKVGTSTVGEVFTEAQISEMHRSIAKP